MNPSRRHTSLLIAAAVLLLALTACGSDASTVAESAEASVAAAEPAATAVVETPALETPVIDTPVAEPSTDETAPDESATAETPAATTASEPTSDEPSAAASADVAGNVTSTFVAEVWADNWFALSVNGEFVGEDSVPITTERSFNAETITFEASYPLTIAVEAKDFKETDSGLEYIGEGNQQMGDGGIIVQITDLATGEIVAVSDGSWAALVVHRAPLNVECETSSDPDTECQFEILETPANWTDPDFDTSSWSAATEWSAAAVSPKDGYNEIAWDPAAQLIWGTDLEVDNTILLRTTVVA